MLLVGASVTIVGGLAPVSVGTSITIPIVALAMVGAICGTSFGRSACAPIFSPFFSTIFAAIRTRRSRHSRYYRPIKDVPRRNRAMIAAMDSQLAVS
jgi:hypothetical protein